MTGLPPEPDDIDFVVAGHDTDPESIQETIEYIRARKSRPEHAEEVKQAMLTLESLGINTSEIGSPDPGGLLAHWHRTVEELKRSDSRESIIGSDSSESR